MLSLRRLDRFSGAVVAPIAAALLLAACVTCGGHPGTPGAREDVGRSPNKRAVASFVAPRPTPQRVTGVRAAKPSLAPSIAKAQPTEESDSCNTAVECEIFLKAIVDNPDRTWVGKRQSALAYANGNRLLAYFALHKKLSCGELVLALEDMQSAAKTFAGPIQGVSPDEIIRVLDMTAEVEAKLQVERARRCE